MEPQRQAQTPPKSAWRRIGRVILWLCLLVFLLFFTLMSVGPGPIEFVIVLMTGWTQFISRTVPNMAWNWDLVAMAVLCTGLIFFLTQGFLGWLSGRIAAARGATWQWPWKWTACGLMAVGLCFLVGMGVAGAVHQLGWLSSQKESWFEVKGSDYSGMRELEIAIQNALMDAQGDLEQVRRDLRNPGSGYFHKRTGESLLIERFHALLILDGASSSDKIAGIIIFPRDPKRRSRTSGRYWFGEKNESFLMKELPDLIEKHQRQLFAL